MKKKQPNMKLKNYATRLIPVCLSLFLMMSCSSNESEPTIEEVFPLVTKIVEESDNNVTTTDFTYEGNRLIKEVSTETYKNYSSTSTLTYIYENDRLTGSVDNYTYDNETYDGTNTETYTYDSDNRIASVTTDLSDANTYTNNLTYNTDGTVIEYYSEYNDNKLIERITFSGGNIASIDSFYGEDNPEGSINLTYDTMNSMFKNVEFREVFLSISSENIYKIGFAGLNNILTEAQNNTNLNNYNKTYSYTYNELGYPITIVETYDNDEEHTANITITYNTDE